ncbi:MAG: hypothetical protein KGR18_01770 [Acidobacteria bacterium]|nr:hypothetical protein [Acidobacteriota bacterium]
MDRQWAIEQLLPGEAALWLSMSGPDRRHSVGVARRTAAMLGPRAERPVLAAALVHDSGKTISGLRTTGRVVATVMGVVVGHDQRRAVRWSAARWPRRPIGQYWRHPELGAELLTSLGSDPLTVTWAREHHLGAAGCSLDPEIADALRRADDD